MRCFVILSLVLAVACGTAKPGGMSGPSMNNHIGGDPGPQVSPVVSKDILAREPVANRVLVKHILIGWKDLADNYDGHIDPRALERSKHDAEAAVDVLLGQLKAGGDFDQLMQTHSEDASSAQSGNPIKVSPDAGLVIEFKQVSLRLEVGEIGVCESSFGFHIIKRVE